MQTIAQAIKQVERDLAHIRKTDEMEKRELKRYRLEQQQKNKTKKRIKQ